MAKRRMTSTPKAARRRARKQRRGVVERRKKEFSYRGYSLDELQAMPLWPTTDDPEEISMISLLPTRARRTLARGLSAECEDLLERVSEAPEGRTVKTHRREMLILPRMVGKTVGVHNGSDFVSLEIKPEMIGGYLGEYATTRRGVAHSGPGVGATRSSKFMPLK